MPIEVQAPAKPRVGVVGLAFPGYQLGEEMCPAKYREMLDLLGKEHLELITADVLVYDEASARKAGEQLQAQGVDCLLGVLTTFVPDYFVVELLNGCDVPIFLWAVEREIGCLSLVCGPLVTATLYNLNKRYALYGADIPDEDTLGELYTFARAAMMQRLLRDMRVGFCGGKCPIMFSLSVDEYAITRKLGPAVVNLPIEELYKAAETIPDAEVAAYWQQTKGCVGEACVREEDGLLSSRYTLVAFRLAEEHRLDALSLNCFPNLKSQVCLAVARLNDAGIAAACEGDLNSTILMSVLQRLSGRPAFNGDFLRLYPEDNSILFSHCGAGAFSLAPCASQVCLQASIETLDGLAVKYPTEMPGPIMLVNMMMHQGSLRLAAMAGEGIETDLSYEGTPLRVRFKENIQGILQGVSRCGAGHHWNGGAGDYLAELQLLCEWLGLPFTALTGK
ncbi:MAG: hypothetical protein ACYDCO_13620 [Armatimonadota bacterium]